MRGGGDETPVLAGEVARGGELESSGGELGAVVDDVKADVGEGGGLEAVPSGEIQGGDWGMRGDCVGHGRGLRSGWGGGRGQILGLGLVCRAGG